MVDAEKKEEEEEEEEKEEEEKEATILVSKVYVYQFLWRRVLINLDIEPTCW